jgi:hypothetical protein
MVEVDSSPSVWLTGFWGFAPEEDGVMGFSDERDRDRFFFLIGNRQLVCVYGAASPETDNRLVHHLLGVLEVERTPIDSWEKISDVAKERNIERGWENKWRFAMPVRRAWRTSRTLDVKQIFPNSYDPRNGRYIAKFGTWLESEEGRWLLEKVPFYQTNVFGEPPVRDPENFEGDTGTLATFLKPSRDFFGGFGVRSYEIQDKPHILYLAEFPNHPELLAGKEIRKCQGVFKIGITGNVKNRLKALNMSFPQTSNIKCNIRRTAEFSKRSKGRRS